MVTPFGANDKGQVARRSFTQLLSLQPRRLLPVRIVFEEKKMDETPEVIVDFRPEQVTVNGISFNLYIEAIVTKVLAEQAILEARTLAGLENRPPDPPDPRSDEERAQVRKLITLLRTPEGRTPEGRRKLLEELEAESPNVNRIRAGLRAVNLA